MAGNLVAEQTASGSNTKPAINTNTDSKKILSNYAVKGLWSDVVDIYKQYPKLHDAQVARIQDTALHVAVSSGREDVVRELVDIISNTADDVEKALNVKNERENTPLHLAAALGNVNMCKIIAGVDNRLIGARNKENETPFFLAALNGNKDAFLCLHDLIIPGGDENDKTDKGYAYCRGSPDGQTILHVAIEKEYFGTPVDELKFTRIKKTYGKPTIVKNFDEETSPNHPENYQTCINLYRLFANAFKIFFRRNKQVDPKRQADPERQDQDHPMFPPNYQTCYELIKFFFKSALIILGFGSRDIRKIQRKREKHTWSVQIMNKLLENSRQYEYLDNGQKPVGPLDEDMFRAGKAEEQASEDNAQKKHLDSMEKLVSSIVGSQESILKEIKTMHTSIAGSQESILKEIQAMSASLDKIAATEVLQHMEGLQSPCTNIDPTLKNETPILLAAKNGIKEMVEKILNTFPRAIDDTNTDEKNIVLLAVESRQLHIYRLMLDWKVDNHSVLRRVDNEGNSALHLAANLSNYRPWLVSGAALQIQWEYKWYEFVKTSVPMHFFIHRNKKGDTPRDVFTNTHKVLVESSRKWLTDTAQSCSVVAALIAGVVFATVTAVPGGLKQDDSGQPVFENKLPFKIFSIAALVALYSSVTALVIFLAILTYHYQEKDFLKGLPQSLLFGLLIIFVSIFAMLVSFSAGHFFVLKDSLKYMSLPVYAIMCFSVTIFVMAQLFPLYFDLIKAKYSKIPQRRQKRAA